MYKISNLFNNENIKTVSQMGPFQVLEYIKDISVSRSSAMEEYFGSLMNVRRRQLLCKVDNGITVQAGAMQWMLGENLKAGTGIKGAGDFLSKAFKGKVSGESAIKPEYTGQGLLMLEPTYKHIILFNLDQWNGSVVLEDGLFLACESQVKQSVKARSNLSSATLGGEGLFNLQLSGQGVFALESDVPLKELIMIELENDTIKIDGSNAICWSSGLEFTVERTTNTLIGSAASGEGLVNVYRGSGKILMAPVL